MSENRTYWYQADGITVTVVGSPFDTGQVQGLPEVMGRLAAEGATTPMIALSIVPDRVVFPDGIDYALFPAAALTDAEGRSPGHIMLCRQGLIRTWVAREDPPDGESFFRLPMRTREPMTYLAVLIYWQESPSAQYERLRSSRGQPSLGIANTGGCDDDCLESNPFTFVNRLRKWSEGNYLREPNSTELLASDSSFWGSGDWKGLLILHGTALQSHVGLRHLSEATVKTICDAYGDRVIALDHKTLENSIGQNVRDLLDRLPTNRKIKLDILAISRGALVARYLAEGHANAYLASRGQTLEVRKVVFVGGANNGTHSAGQPGPLFALSNFAVSKCMACRKCFNADKPNNKCCDAIALAELESAIGVLFADSGLQGQKDLRENSAMVRLINRRDTTGGASLPSTLVYHAITGKYSCSADKKGCTCGGTPFLGGKPNDLVITLDSVCKPELGGNSAFKKGAKRFPITGDRLLETTRPHSELLKGSAVATKLIGWLNGGL